MNLVSEAFDRFERVGETLDPGLRAELIALGPAAIPGLRRFLEDSRHWDIESPSKGWAPLHAVELLVELGAVETIEPMLDALCETDWDDMLHDALMRELPKLGGAVLEPALARLSTKQPVARVGLCAVLSNLGVRDPRIFDALCALLALDPAQGALCLGDYRDPAALPLLAQAIEAVDLESRLGTVDLPALVEAHEEIAPLPPALRARVDEMFAQVNEAVASLPPPSIMRLSRADEALAPALRAEVLALGPAAIPGLMRILDEEEFNEGWGAVHAAELLIELRALEAVDPLLDVLCGTDWDEVLHDRLIVGLPKLGAALVEPALALLAEDLSEEQRDSVCSVLADLGIRDARIYEQLSRLFSASPYFGAVCLGDYGDPAALPLLIRAIEQFAPHSSGRVELQAYVEAHEKLGPMTPALRARTDELFAALEAARRAAGPARRAENQVGRNDPCPCGSGLKFKKCCIGKTAS